MKLLVTAAAALLLTPCPAFCQSSAVSWSAFDIGYGAPFSPSAQVQSVAGQGFVGASLSASTEVESGFLIYQTATIGYPPNTGTFVVKTISDTGTGSLRWAIQ